jgi:aminomethyltransferase
LILEDQLEPLPKKGDKLFHGEREVGVITSIVTSPRLKRTIALGYARREVSQIGTQLTVGTEGGPGKTRVVGLPFSLKSAADG